MEKVETNRVRQQFSVLLDRHKACTRRLREIRIRVVYNTEIEEVDNYYVSQLRFSWKCRPIQHESC